MFFSDYTKSVMRSPHVVEGLLADLYLSPLDLRTTEDSAGITTLELAKDQPQRYGEFTLMFRQFEMANHDAGHITVGAQIMVAGPQDTVAVAPQYETDAEGRARSPEFPIPGTPLTIALTRIFVERRTVEVRITDAAKAGASPGKDILTLEVSRKPLISLVWLGVLLITLGSLISLSHRWRQLRGPGESIKL
jgi:hypothetical protein